MQQIAATMRKAVGTRLTWVSDYCTSIEHVPRHKQPKAPVDQDDWDAIAEYQQKIASLREQYKVQKMDLDGQVVCPRCRCEAETDAMQKEAQARFNQQQQEQKTSVLYNQSVLQDEELAVARFEHYRTDDEPLAYQNLMLMQQHAKDIIEGQAFNILLYGPPGVGKSHLSYSLLHYVNVHSQGNKTCLFIDLDQMLRLIRDSFNNRESKYTELYFTDLLSKVDVLVLDDLGAETGNEDTQKTASDYTGRILRAVANSRQSKITIITTNLPGTQLNKMYDGKTLSRLSKNRRAVLFDDRVQDKRPLEGY